MAEPLALEYAARGWYVFPCKPDKSPYTQHGKNDATQDPDQIRRWWSTWPDAKIGIYCERSGIFVLDIDVKNGRDGWQSWTMLIKEHGVEDIPVGPIQSTPSGGWHLFFNLPKGLRIPNNVSKIGAGLDLRSNGYICSGDGYKWRDDEGHSLKASITDAPAWLLDLIRNLGRARTAAPATPSAPISNNGNAGGYWLGYYLYRAREGNRNNIGFNLALQLRDSWVPEGEAEALMRQYAQSVPGDGYSEGEALASLKQAYLGARRESARLPGITAPPPQPDNRDYREPPMGNASHPQPAEPERAPDEIKGAEKKWAKSWEYVEILQKAGYDFRLCELDDTLFVNDERMTDPLDAEIKSKLRDQGYHKVNVAADAYLAYARAHSFHPVKDYLKSITWDGGKWIEALAGYIQDRFNLSSLILRKWLIGAVARIYTHGRQNRVMVLEGPQGCGKSYFARWLGSGLNDHFSEAMPNPDDKDSRLALATVWIWEIKELGSVTRRADIDALKAWLTLESINERLPYGKYPVYKPAITSFIATVNDAGGFFNDPTGNRRYMTLALSGLNWNYAREIDVNQVWGQAAHFFEDGEDWNLNADEQAQVQVVNDEFEFTPPAYDWLEMYTEPTSSEIFTPTDEILQAMKLNGLSGSDVHLSRQLSGWMKRTGYEAGRGYIDVKVQAKNGNQMTANKRVRGFFGIELRKKAVILPFQDG